MTYFKLLVGFYDNLSRTKRVEPIKWSQWSGPSSYTTSNIIYKFAEDPKLFSDLNFISFSPRSVLRFLESSFYAPL